MKLVIVMYLEEDEECVQRLLRESGVQAFSRMSMEGIGEGVGSWYGGTVPFESRMAFTVVSAERAATILSAIESEDRCLDQKHPMRAVQLAVEASTAIGTSGPASSRDEPLRERMP